ncbi:unnamed protein product, partial [Prorocentrum cordatum]
PFCFLALRKGTGAKPVREYRRVRRGGGGLARRPRHLPARKKGGAIGRRWDERGLPPKHPRTTDDHPLRTSVPRPPRSAAVQTHLGSDEGSATRPARSALATRQLGPACSLNVIASPARRPPRLHARVTLGRSDLWCVALGGPLGERARARKPPPPHRVRRTGNPLGPAPQATPAERPPLRMWSTRPLAPTHPGRVPWGSGTRTSTPPAWAGGEVDEGHQLRRRYHPPLKAKRPPLWRRARC